MIKFRLGDLARAACGWCSAPDLEIQAVSTDSRNCKGALFVALKGEKHDAHDFVQSAVANGAAAVAVRDSFPGIRDLTARTAVVTGRDTLRLLGLAGLLVRRQSRASVAALTGTCGKTTVKELTAAILSIEGKTLATAGNFNNDVGVPLTLLRLEADHEFAVIEQGASHIGDIARTCEFVEAGCALINNVGQAHLEGFGSPLGVYLGKTEILHDVTGRGGIGIVPADSPFTPRWMLDFAKARRERRLWTFGMGDGCLNDAGVRVSILSENDAGMRLRFFTPVGNFDTALSLCGRHNALNAAAAAALALAAGAGCHAARLGISRVQAMPGRLRRQRFGSLTLIDDAYNASFDAVCAAIDVLSGCQGRRIMIFGDMGELGEASASLHRQVGSYAAGRIDELWCTGEKSALSAEAAGRHGRYFADRQDLVREALALCASRCGVSVLIKGSHAMALDSLVADMCRAAQAAAGGIQS